MAQVRLDIHDADGRLPNVCMRCGDEASVTKTRDMSWCPPWVGILILAGLLPYVIVAILMTKRARVQVPLCEKHAWHWFNRNLFIWLGLVALLAIFGLFIAATVALPREHQDTFGTFICLGGGGLGFIWLIGVIVAQSTAIRPKEITDHEITLDGVSADFVDAVDDLDRKRRERLRGRRREDDWDDDDDERPRRKRAAADEFEDDRPRRSREDSEGIEEDRPSKKRPRGDDDDG